MNYDREILSVLEEAGVRGLSVKKISCHVFNRRNNFFDTVSFDEVCSYVAGYLKRSVRSKDHVIERTGIRGVYRINMSRFPNQLQFDFRDNVPDANEDYEKSNVEDKSLSLF